jgi:hypothetical protein
LLQDEAEEKDNYDTRMRRLAESALSDVKSKKRKFRELELREVRALQDFKGAVKEPIRYIQEAVGWGKAAKRSRLQAKTSMEKILGFNGFEDSDEEGARGQTHEQDDGESVEPSHRRRRHSLSGPVDREMFKAIRAETKDRENSPVPGGAFADGI